MMKSLLTISFLIAIGSQVFVWADDSKATVTKDNNSTSDNKSTSDTNNDNKANNAAAPAAPATPAITETAICSICHCDKTKKLVNCANQNLNELFSIGQWTKLANESADALDTVIFDNNGISHIPQFPKLNIKSLSFRNNKISSIESMAFLKLGTLRSLDISFNKLTSASLKPDVFQGPYDPSTYEPLKNMSFLSLANNDIHTLDPDLFEHFPNLEALSISHNPFKVIDPNTAIAISTLHNLKMLDISDMELTRLPDHLLHSPRELKVLNMSGNLFETLPETLQDAINLEELNLDDNNIEAFGGNATKFPKLAKLTSLSISHSPKLLEIGDGAFQELAALQHFDCQHNLHLQSIHQHAFVRPGEDAKQHGVWPPIRSLLLNNNNLSVIDQGLIGRWDEVEQIDIRYNPFRCDCETQWLVDTLIPQLNQSKDASGVHEILCNTPVEMNSWKMYDLHEKNVRMRCSDYYGRRPERDGPILVGVFIGILIGVPLTLALIAAYRRGCFGIFGYRPSPNDYGRAFYKRAELRNDF